jgi:ATP-binding cassette subfamily F protein 3
VENMPRHHHILHVRQEIQAAGGDISVLQAVIEADVERNTLIEEKKQILK